MLLVQVLSVFFLTQVGSEGKAIIFQAILHAIYGNDQYTVIQSSGSMVTSFTSNTPPEYSPVLTVCVGESDMAV